MLSYALEEVAPRPRVERAVRVDIALEHRQHDDPSIGRLAADGRDHVDAAHVAKPQIHERDVRAHAEERLDALMACGGAAHHAHVGLRIEQRNESLDDDGMVVNAQKSNLLRSV
jgi:hypothetical protein